MSLRNQRARTDERHLAYIDLLDKVAVFANRDPVAFERIRLNLRAVIAWFTSHTGWSVHHTPECIRLVRPPARALAGHGFPWGRASTPRDYAMLTWILWYGEAKSADQFTLTTIAKEIQDRSGEVVAPGYVDWNVREHRAALRNAIGCLEEMRLIQHIDGDVRPYVEEGTGDALYEFTPLAPQFQVNLPNALWDGIVLDRNPVAIDVLAGEDDRLEYRAYRTLLLCPAVFAAEDPEVFAFVRQYRRQIADQIADTFGWSLEVTGGYACILRSAQDTRGRAVFPTQAGETHLVLLLANALRVEVEAGTLMPHLEHDTIALSLGRLEQILAEVAAEHRTSWSAEFAALDTEGLVARALATLRAWGMLEGPDAWNTIHILPVLGRYAGVYRADGAGLGVTPNADPLEETAA